MSTIVKKTRKRVKLQCLECGSNFDDDYRKKHEVKCHGGKRVKIKHFCAPENPFEASKKKSNLVSIIF